MVGLSRFLDCSFDFLSSNPTTLLIFLQTHRSISSMSTEALSHIYAKFEKYKGQQLALFSSFMAGLIVPLFKYFLNNGASAPQVLLVRYVPPLTITLILGLFMRNVFANKNWYYFSKNMDSFKMLSIRSFFHFLSNLCWLLSLSLIPITINLPISQAYPIFTILLGHCFLNESLTIWDIILAMTGFFGVCIISDPTFQTSISVRDINGILLAILSPIFYSIQLIILRRKKTSYHWAQTEAVVGLLSTFIFIPICLFCAYFIFKIEMYTLIKFENVSSKELFLYILTGTMEFISIGCVAKALQTSGNIAMISIILYSEVFWAILFQCLFLHDTTNFNTYGLWIGLALIVISTILITFKQNNKNNNNQINIINEENNKEKIKINSKYIDVNDDNNIKNFTIQNYGSIEHQL